MKVGIISLYWPPHFGGSERYVNRLANALNGRGIETWGITATPAIDGMDNGIDNVHRILVGEDRIGQSNQLACEAWFKLVLVHVRENNYTHILVNSPLTLVTHPFTTKLFDGLYNIPNLKYGIVHHDIGLRLRGALEENYKRCGDWETSAQIIEKEQREYFNNDSSLFNEQDAYWAFDSPLFFAPHFVIGNAHWSNRFIDPLNTTPKYVLHPLMEKDITPYNKTELDEVDVMMVNPIYHKGRSYMADVINTYSHTWSYRVLMGAYGSGKKEFLSMIENSWAKRDGRIDIVKYVEDIRQAYNATKIFMCPSRYEGYGMVAVEPMLQSKPVIVHNYPAIIEAVGDAAYILDWGCDSRDWEDAIEEILLDDEEWVNKSKLRGEYLLKRQEIEIDELINFLESV